MATAPSPYFRTGWDGALPKIIGASLCFHLLVLGVLFVAGNLHFEKKPEPVKVFELVQLPSQMKAPMLSSAPHHAPRPRPQPVPPKPEPVKKVAPQITPSLPPEPKIAKTKTEPEPAPQQEQPAQQQTASDDDFPTDDMNLPTAFESSSLNPVGSVDMDPLMQVYLERLKQIIMQHFNPPSGMNISKSAKTTVQFTVDRFGNITDITLKRSSGNGVWDHLSMRAIQVSKVPELPPNYRAPALTLHFNFTPD